MYRSNRVGLMRTLGPRILSSALTSSTRAGLRWAARCTAAYLLTRRVVKYRKRLGTKLTAAAAEIPATEPEESMDIVREKHFALKPCSTEEAILQMDLLGHSFFLYHSTENDKIQVVYRRADGGYGVLIPEA